MVMSSYNTQSAGGITTPQNHKTTVYQPTGVYIDHKIFICWYDDIYTPRWEGQCGLPPRYLTLPWSTILTFPPWGVYL